MEKQFEVDIYNGKTLISSVLLNAKDKEAAEKSVAEQLVYKSKEFKRSDIKKIKN